MHFPSTSRSVLAGLLLPLASALPAQEPAAPPAPPPANYVVHEWGTFTSMLGTDGASLEGLHHEEEQLPKFVHDLLKVEAFAPTEGTKLPASRVTQKMETPVIYFHADEPLRVGVRVWFSQGLMTQFYPLPSTIFPELGLARQQRLDMSKVEGSWLTWDVDVVPRSQPAPAGIPAVPADDPWSFARQTSAAYVRTRPEQDSPVRPEAEHYLFYRGLGRWQPAVTMQSTAGGNARLQNGMAQAIPFCLLLELGERGGRFVVGRPVAAGAEHAFDLGPAEWHGDREKFARRVGACVLQALVQQGLYLDEARAMVATWSRSWFQKDGARVVYLLPREQVDAVLPLDLQPRPKELVRVLVGRLEFITPEAQARVEHALLERAAGDAAGVVRADATLASLDRFLEPHLRNVAANGSSAALRSTAQALLAEATR